MQTRRLSLFGRMRVSQNVALLWHGVATTAEEKNGEPSEQSSEYNNKNSENVHFYNIMVAQQVGGDFDVVDRERF